MKRKDRNRYQMLMARKKRGLIKLPEVALILQVSVHTCNNSYLPEEIIQPCVAKGNLHLYDLFEIKWTRKHLKELRPETSIKQCGKIIAKERNQGRETNPIQYEDPIEGWIIS